LERTVTACGTLSASEVGSVLDLRVRSQESQPLGGGVLCDYRPGERADAPEPGRPAVVSLFIFFRSSDDPAISGNKAYLRFFSETPEPVPVSEVGSRAFYGDGRLGVLRDDIYFDLTAVGVEIDDDDLRPKLIALAKRVDRTLGADR